MTNYWIGVVSKDHVDIGVAGCYTQVNHGKAAPLERMRAGDGFAFYSPRMSYPDGEPLQAFTAIGRIRNGTVYQAAGSDSAGPFRLDVDYFPAQPAPVRPLIEELTFSKSRVTSLDWVSYPILRFKDSPTVTTVSIQRADLPSTGSGEPVNAPVAAAVANAFFDATGVRIRRAPMTPARVRAVLKAASVA